MAKPEGFSKVVKFDLGSLRRSVFVERTNARLTQDDVAATIGCSRKWVSRFERGLSVPSFEIVIAYAAMFGIEIYMALPDASPDMTTPSKGVSNFE
ncbi:helix-turn-helix domain-containing protein [Pararhizobium sp. BT-229]|uniref:helix-turn-helix domain-containing protein n=1 Tax=Pararhizobium sp. BT-229 TaxID=2986923 RepID=UPI0021F73CA8|nr:helix-turn-helix transcriptional regulator [Pararhizobium sp. BT-229]MCV9964391.1 helix-turn-helix domain-containing protein [Pararhizobium sp. BT-229]